MSHRKKKKAGKSPQAVAIPPSRGQAISTAQSVVLLAVGFGLGLWSQGYPLPALALCSLLVIYALGRAVLASNGSLWKKVLTCTGVSVVVLGAAFLTLLKATPWSLERAEPLSIDPSISSIIKRPLGGTIGGIKWEPDYKLLRVYLKNESRSFSIDQIDLHLDLAGVEIKGIGLDGGTARCVMGPSGDIGPLTIDPNSAFVIRPDGVAMPLKLATSKYVVNCDHLGTGREPIPLVIAVLKKPSQITVNASYDLVDGERRIRKSQLMRQPVKSN